MNSDLTRRETLLREAEAEFERLGSPFVTAWLDEHQVTLNEAGDLSEDIARAIRFYLQAPPSVRTEDALRHALQQVFR